jgi:prophage regulatory protein
VQSQKSAAPGSSRIIDKRAVLARVPFGNTTLYEGVREGWFPRPLKLTSKSVGWLESEIDAWIAARAAERASTASPADTSNEAA